MRRSSLQWRYLPVIAALLLTLAGCGGAIPDYFPMAKGNQWQYRVTRFSPDGQLAGTAELRLQITDVLDPVTAIVRYNDGNAERYAKTHGYLSATGAGERINYLLRLPPIAGEKWTLYSLDDETLEDRILFVYRIESVSDALYGEQHFKSVAVVICENDNGTIKLVYFWAPDIGLIRRETYIRETLDWTLRETVELVKSQLLPQSDDDKKTVERLTLDGAKNRESYLTDIVLPPL